ncbi:hypothetical protein LQ327_09515 [Actinomycetospora endophytica]|uniref:Uncharacterized protein n=1 Tax=Actinomycetospora endophytica TaxID=2291215 RepID=A0ABS8P6F9_9PSEU|nr:hypothetical protein [Actinomycetospora endophytica]MCD2193618.1 hypothetical protein [Actinomycetospora endophytica]
MRSRTTSRGNARSHLPELRRQIAETDIQATNRGTAASVDPGISKAHPH